jgi:hypothetical protein
MHRVPWIERIEDDIFIRGEFFEVAARELLLDFALSARAEVGSPIPRNLRD